MVASILLNNMDNLMEEIVYREEELRRTSPLFCEVEGLRARLQELVRGYRREKKATLIRNVVRETIERRGEPVHRSELFVELWNMKLLKNNSPRAVGGLSVYLSRWKDEFKTDGRGNWSLVEPTLSQLEKLHRQISKQDRGPNE